MFTCCIQLPAGHKIVLFTLELFEMKRSWKLNHEINYTKFSKTKDVTFKQKICTEIFTSEMYA